MFNMGFTEMLVLGAIALLVIGPKQLPEVARTIGRMLNEFKRATNDLTSSFNSVKNEAESYVNKTTQYMHEQREQFEKNMNSLETEIKADVTKPIGDSEEEASIEGNSEHKYEKPE